MNQLMVGARCHNVTQEKTSLLRSIYLPRNLPAQFFTYMTISQVEQNWGHNHHIKLQAVAPNSKLIRERGECQEGNALISIT